MVNRDGGDPSVIARLLRTVLVLLGVRGLVHRFISLRPDEGDFIRFEGPLCQATDLRFGPIPPQPQHSQIPGRRTCSASPRGGGMVISITADHFSVATANVQ